MSKNERDYTDYFNATKSNENAEQPKRASKENRRYIGKIKELNGKNGSFETIWCDNNDASSQYYQGTLIFRDKEGKEFKVKQMGVGNINEQTRQRGFRNSIYLDLDSEYHTEEV